MTAAAGVVLLVPIAVGLAIGPRAFAAAVLAVGLLAAVDLTGVLARQGQRPIVVAAVLPAIAMPVVAALDPAQGWQRFALIELGAVFLAFALALLFGRRRGIVVALGATGAVALVVGLGVGGLVLVRGLEDGVRWVVGLLALGAAADLGGPALAAVAERAGRQERSDPPPPAPLRDLLGGFVAVVVVAVALAVLLAPPFDGRTAGALALVALVAAAAGRGLRAALAQDLGLPPPGAEALRLGEGLVLGVTDVVLYSAPAAYVLARAGGL